MDTDATVAKWIRPEIRELTAYHVPDAGSRIKLDAMENPYVWPTEVVEQWLERLRVVHVNRYPDPHARKLTERLRQSMGVPTHSEIILGNGSDELIQLIALAVAGPGRVILAPEPSFVMYRMIARFTGLQYLGVPLRSHEFSLDAEAMRTAISRHQPAVVFLACPNNPTGNLFDASVVEEIVASAPGLVVVDEAYAPFAQASLMEGLGRHDNLLVMRTVSKMGLAGLRLGLLAGNSVWIRELNKVRLPYNINVLTQVSTEFALEHESLLEEQTSRIRADREVMYTALTKIQGIHPYPSRANFILVRLLAHDADFVCAALNAGGVLIKNLHATHPALENCIRVTVGTPHENAKFLELFAAILARNSNQAS